LAIAVGPDWTMALWTIGLFVVVEPLIGQALEPLLYGRSTGLSPVAVILAATFWTWLWGPIGLLLSTPVTVCLAVLGRHIQWLEFVDVLIGREEPLSPPQRFYQRALAKDLNEVTDQAEEMLKNISLLEYYDGVVLPGLVLAQIDFARGVLDGSHIEGINEVMEELVDELSDHEDGARSTEEAEGAASKEARAKEPSAGTGERAQLEWLPECGIACLWGRGPFDKALAAVLAQLLEKHGLKPQVGLASETSNVIKLGSPEVKVVCLSSLHIGRSSAQIRYSVRRMRGRFAQAKVLLCLWGDDLGELGGRDQAINRDADCYAASFKDALDCLRSEEGLGEARPPGFDAIGPGAA
jgi:hypothetical protein